MASYLRNITVSVEPHVHNALSARAKAEGYTLHRWMQRLLNDQARISPGKVLRQPATMHTMPSDSNIEPMTETVIVELSLSMAMRLQTAARQMRDPSGTPVSPAWLCRQLVMHVVHKRSDIVERIKAEVDPSYRDIVPFVGRLRQRAGREWYPQPMKCTFAGRNDLFAIAKQRGVTVTDLVRKIIDRALPTFTDERDAPEAEHQASEAVEAQA